MQANTTASPLPCFVTLEMGKFLRKTPHGPHRKIGEPLEVSTNCSGTRVIEVLVILQSPSAFMIALEKQVASLVAPDDRYCLSIFTLTKLSHSSPS